MSIHNFDSNRPYTLLPLPPPKEYSPAEEYGEDFFYKNVGKALIDTTIRLMNTGLPIDLNKVEELEKTITEVLNDVEKRLSINPLIDQYYSFKYPKLLEEHNQLYASKLHKAEEYLKPFDVTKLEHRSYYMYCFIKNNPDLCYDIIPSIQTLPTGVPKWSKNAVKKILYQLPQLEHLVAKTTRLDDPIAIEAMELLAKHTAEKRNNQYDYYTRANANSKADLVPKFNCGSADQKHELLTGMLHYESDKLSDAYIKYEKQMQDNSRNGIFVQLEVPKNKYSWSRDEIEKLQKTVTEGSDIWNLLQCLIDYSFAAIIRNNFIKAFYTNTINGRLYPNLKLFGAKSGRYTCSKPNLLQLPSTGSIFAKPVKKCFIAPPGHVIATIDYAALNTSGVLYSNV